MQTIQMIETAFGHKLEVHGLEFETIGSLFPFHSPYAFKKLIVNGALLLENFSEIDALPELHGIRLSLCILAKEKAEEEKSEFLAEMNAEKQIR